VGEQLSILRLIAQASVPVQIVIGILLLAWLRSYLRWSFSANAVLSARTPRSRPFRKPLLVGR